MVYEINKKIRQIRQLNKVWSAKHLGHIIPPREAYILSILESQGECTQKEIAESLKISTSAVTEPIKALHEKELIHKTQDGDDLRRNTISITPEGSSVIGEVDGILLQLDERMTVSFTADEKVILDSYLDRIIENLQVQEA